MSNKKILNQTDEPEPKLYRPIDDDDIDSDDTPADRPLIAIVFCHFIFILLTIAVTAVFIASLSLKVIYSKDIAVTSFKSMELSQLNIANFTTATLDDDTTLGKYIYNCVNPDRVTQSDVDAILNNRGIELLAEAKFESYVNAYKRTGKFEPITVTEVLQVLKDNESVLAEHNSKPISVEDYAAISAMLNQVLPDFNEKLGMGFAATELGEHVQFFCSDAILAISAILFVFLLSIWVVLVGKYTHVSTEVLLFGLAAMAASGICIGFVLLKGKDLIADYSIINEMLKPASRVIVVNGAITAAAGLLLTTLAIRSKSADKIV